MNNFDSLNQIGCSAFGRYSPSAMNAGQRSFPISSTTSVLLHQLRCLVGRVVYENVPAVMESYIGVQKHGDMIGMPWSWYSKGLVADHVSPSSSEIEYQMQFVSVRIVQNSRLSGRRAMLGSSARLAAGRSG